ncbi:MAG: hypothetical protein A4E30_00136 [Methanomassiliicoccales archaeon PtaB.Bin215]|nr:MAG: hypothetical protein A4E30_00136 [Methanomassiliicoccales archaeon PtaB.Bin215]
MAAPGSRSFLYGTSMAYIAAPRGARNTAESPAAAPAMAKVRMSPFLSFSRPPKKEATAAPMCMMGPSLPPLPPVPRVRAETTILYNPERGGTFPPL